MKRCVFTPAAIQDLDGIWDYTFDKWGPAQADHVGTVEARKFMDAWRQAGHDMDRTPTLARRWTRMCFCGQQTAAGPVANKGVFGQAEFTGSEEGRGPLYDADHHGDLIILVDAHLGMSVVWGAEGAQVRDVLL